MKWRAFVAVKWQRTFVTTTKCRHVNPSVGKNADDWVCHTKAYISGDENLPKVANEGIRAWWRHCSRLLNNNFGQVVVQNGLTPKQEPVQSQTTHQNKVWKSSSATNKDTRTTSRWCSSGFIAIWGWRSTHSSSTPFFHSKQTNAGNVDIV